MADSRSENAAHQAQRPTQTVQRAFVLLDLLAAADRPLPLTEVAARASLHPSTCLRLLRTAESHGFVERLRGSGHYRLGAKVFSLAYGLERQLDVRTLARPVLQRLSDRIQEGASFVVRVENEAMVLERIQARAESGIHLGVGARGPLFCTAAGKALLAFGDRASLEDVLQGPLPQLTPMTLTDPSVLRADLEQCHVRGYAIDNGERRPNLIGISAPVWERDGRLAGVVATSGPSARLTSTALPQIAEAVLAAAREISARLNHSGTSKDASVHPRSGTLRPRAVRYEG